MKTETLIWGADDIREENKIMGRHNLAVASPQFSILTSICNMSLHSYFITKQHHSLDIIH